MDPLDTDRLVAGTILDRVAYSVDGGATWIDGRLESSYGVWGDPVIDIDEQGNFYYFHLSNPQDGHWIDRIVCQRSEDGGRTWTSGSFAGLNAEKQQDKHWSVVDRKNGIIYLTWTEFDEYGSKDSSCYSRIRFSKSVDRGETWSPAVTISEAEGDCIDDDQTTEGAVPAIGPDGQIYVCWADRNGLNFTRSEDGGESWMKPVVIDPMPGGWSFDIPGIYRCNGMPITLCDVSGGNHHGTVYVNWSDQRNGEEDTDVWIISSKDGGMSWSDPVRVNDDPPGKHQFFTWMTIDQTDGTLYGVFYDRRRYEDDRTDVFLVASNDGGLTFQNQRVSENSFIPSKEVFFGDYNDISAHGGQVRPIWTRMEDGKTSVWTALVEWNNYLTDDAVQLDLEFELSRRGKVCLEVIDPSGDEQRLFRQRMSSGEHRYTYIWQNEEWKKGTYRFRLRSRKNTIWSTEKIIR